MNWLTIALLINATLLGDHYFFHLKDGHGTFDVDPFVLNHVLQLQLEDEVDAANVPVRHESEPARLIRPLVLQDHTIFDLTEVGEVGLEARQVQVVWQATNEDFAELRINLVSRAQGLLPNALECAQLLLILLHLLIRESLSLR